MLLSQPPSQLPVAILGATGTVGQKAVQLIDRHPHFRVAEVAASEKNVGRAYTYGETNLIIQSPTDVKSPFVLSALPAQIAESVEPILLARGQHVFSNASTFRMRSDVPLLIPEVNLEHLELLDRQQTPGKLVTNPNCATTFVALALAPLLELGLGEVRHVSVVTLQAISGAGYPGVSALDTTGNIIPYIDGEEEKITRETQKILGSPTSSASFSVTAHVHRVPVVHGHTVVLHVHFSRAIDVAAVQAGLEEYRRRYPDVYCLYDNPFEPQPRKHIDEYDQRVHIGRIKQGNASHIIGLIAMGHNLVRGAAGATLLNMEAASERLGK